MPVQILVSVWAFLTATRITRGDEEDGRADLLLAGRLRAADLLGRSLATLGAAAVLIASAVAMALLIAGTHPAGAFTHAAGVLGMTLTFAAGGALAAQILPTRSAAAGLTTAALGVVLLLRMLADGIDMFSWAAWITPFGLTAHAAPYAGNRITPLLMLAAFPVLLTAAAITLTRRRDIGRGLVNPSGHRRPKTWLLRSITGFAVRRSLRTTAGWATGIAAYFLLVGALIASVLRFLQENPRFAELAAAAGFTGLQTAEGFAAAMFSLLAIPVGLYAAIRIAAFAADESHRRWTLLLALPIPRRKLVTIEITVTAAGVLALLTTAGLAVGLGAEIAGASLSLASTLTGVWNVAPIALLSLGAAVFALGWLPRAVAAIGALPVAGGFLLDVTVQSTGAPAWLTYLTPFGHLGAVPAAPPDWSAIAVLIVIAGSLSALGVLGYARRDLTT